MNIPAHFLNGAQAPASQHTTPSRAIASNDGWCPVDEAFTEGPSIKGTDWDGDDVKQIFAQMGRMMEGSKQTRHTIAMGAQQEVSRIQDEVAQESRRTQEQLSSLARQASLSGMSSFGMGYGGPSSYAGSYATSGVNTGIGMGNAGMLNNPMLNNPNMNDPNYLRTLTDSDLRNMGLDPMMVRDYINNPTLYPGGLGSMVNNYPSPVGSFNGYNIRR
ncbi:hypothetical protein DYH09_33905 [bacterium CPR1]|nr:hypothetical protein [bacterium CPR1]